MDLNGSKTEKNILKAFEVTALRRMEYDIYALIAERQGYNDVARLLSRFANNEKEHSKLWYKWLKSNNGNFPKKIVKSYEEIILNYAWSLLCARFSFVLFRKKLC